jgi:hypothetical protein
MLVLATPCLSYICSTQSLPTWLVDPMRLVTYILLISTCLLATPWHKKGILQTGSIEKISILPACFGTRNLPNNGRMPCRLATADWVPWCMAAWKKNAYS